MKHKLLHSTAIALAVINAVAGISLLMLSGWFIAASALAGLSSAAIIFNYLIPAGAIRMLALTRIASGYAENAVGHHSLLERLYQLRLSWFDRIMKQRSSHSLRAEQAEHLNQTVEDSANIWLRVIHPNIANFFILTLATTLLACFTPYALNLWGGVIAMNLIMMALLYKKHKTAEASREQQQNLYRTELEHHLNAAPIWFLSQKYYSGDAIKSRAQKWLLTLARQRVIDANGEALLILFSGLALVALLCWLPSQHYSSALMMLPVILLLSTPEWLGNTLRSIRQHIAAKQARQHLPQPETDSEELTQPTPFSLSTEPKLELNQYNWQQESIEGKAITAHFSAGQLIWLKGSSGSGKSSLLIALAGLLKEKGQVRLNGTELNQFAIRQRQQALHYVEQFPYVLSDTLYNNLLLAKPESSQAALTEAMSFAELDELHSSLEQWVGESGRQLSGGEVKRLGLARAYLHNAPVWLLDEPFEGLDAERQASLLVKLQEKAKSESRIIILASHLWPESVQADQSIELD